MTTQERANRELRYPLQHRSLADEYDAGDVLQEMFGTLTDCNKAAGRMNEMAGYFDCQSDLLDAYMSKGVAGLKAVMYHGSRWAEYVDQYEAGR